MNEDRIAHLEAAVASIQERNRRVEAEKAWEGSKTRIVSNILLTYFVMCLVLITIGHDQFYIHAIVPTIGYFLSTLSLPIIKKIWVNVTK